MSAVIAALDLIFSELDDAYRVVANVHGLSLREIAVNLVPGMLTLSGHRSNEASDDLECVGLSVGVGHEDTA